MIESTMILTNLNNRIHGTLSLLSYFWLLTPVVCFDGNDELDGVVLDGDALDVNQLASWYLYNMVAQNMLRT